eukprot:TRINITY_DN36746_c0_g1_i2.p1 TRINITY_DN36746_c0_g1~~TRINITY_DN36746_c0_g1_i2.p1  ORF type:complete len:810 (+),score=193.99 TRINITY_DN36746_c0_g1_i2:68-2497(+)
MKPSNGNSDDFQLLFGELERVVADCHARSCTQLQAESRRLHKDIESIWRKAKGLPIADFATPDAVRLELPIGFETASYDDGSAWKGPTAGAVALNGGRSEKPKKSKVSFVSGSNGETVSDPLGSDEPHVLQETHTVDLSAAPARKQIIGPGFPRMLKASGDCIPDASALAPSSAKEERADELSADIVAIEGYEAYQDSPRHGSPQSPGETRKLTEESDEDPSKTNSGEDLAMDAYVDEEYENRETKVTDVPLRGNSFAEQCGVADMDGMCKTRSQSLKLQKYGLKDSNQPVEGEAVEKFLKTAFKRCQNALKAFTEGKPEPPKLTGWRKKLADICEGSVFELIVAIIILLNTIYMGIQVEMSIRDPVLAEGAGFKAIEIAFSCMFIVELVMRLLAQGSHFFLHRINWCWNLFDFILVSASIVEIAAEIAAALETATETTAEEDSGSNMNDSARLLRILRTSKLVRLFRTARLVRFVQALRNLVWSIICTLKSLFWSLLLLVMIMFCTGMIFAQSIGLQLSEMQREGTAEWTPELERIDYWWGSLSKSMFTLFKSVSEGVSWHECVIPLTGEHEALVVVFVAYVGFIYFAVLNVIAGVFCDSAIQASKQDPERFIMDTIVNKRNYVRRVKDLFKEIDTDESKVISVPELAAFMEEEMSFAFFEFLELEVDDASEIIELMDLIDADQSGSVDIDEFVAGLLKLRGSASALELAKVKVMVKEQVNALERLYNQNESTARRLSQMEARGLEDMSLDSMQPKLDGGGGRVTLTAKVNAFSQLTSDPKLSGVLSRPKKSMYEELPTTTAKVSIFR